jgi:hypothetical protein
VVHGAGQAVPDQLEQRLGTRVMVHGNSQAVPDQLEQRLGTRAVVHGTGHGCS